MGYLDLSAEHQTTDRGTYAMDLEQNTNTAARANHAKTIRAHLTANPGATHREAAEALGMDKTHCRRHMAVMLRRGLLRFEQADESEDRRYFVAREVIKPYALEPGEASKRLRDREAARNANRRSLRVKVKPMRNVEALTARSFARQPEPRSAVAMTTDEWLQKGGVIERLPTRWAA
jgi:hypothetical protein